MAGFSFRSIWTIFQIAFLLEISESVAPSYRYKSDKSGKDSDAGVGSQTGPERQTPKIPIPEYFQILSKLDEKLSRCGSNAIDIRELDVTQLQSLFRNKKLTSAELTNCYLHRIKAMNPMLHAVTQISPTAVRDANKADSELSMGLKRSNLHGIPIIIKDNIGTEDGMENTAGALALLGLKPKQDATVVKKLRKAGAVILGKANLSEFAYFRGFKIPEGWSGVGGQTFCPYNASAGPSGSSSGSAVAVAANLATVALGSETDGSIAAPAARQALFGLKPTKGLVSTKGVIPLSFSQDVVGPITRTAADATIVLDVIAEEMDSTRIPKNRRGTCGFTTCNSQTGVDVSVKYRVGVVRDVYWNETAPSFQEIKKDLEGILKELVNTGSITLIDPAVPEPKSFDQVSADGNESGEMTVFLHEFKYGINSYLRDDVHRNPETKSAGGRQILSLADIIEFNKEDGSTKMFNQNILEASQATDGLGNRTYKAKKEQNIRASRKYLDFLLDAYDLDALVGPVEEKMNTSMIFSMAAISGYPSFTIPVGVNKDGVPFGMTFVGTLFSDKTLVRIGGLTKSHRSPPKFLQ